MGVKRSLLFGVHSLCAGGTERVVSGFLNELSASHDFELHCVLYGRRREQFYALDSEITVHKPSFDFDKYPRAISTLKTISFLRSVVNDLQPIAFYNFGERWNNLALLSTLGLSTPVIVADRSSPAASLGSSHEFLRKRLYPHARTVIVQTNEAKETLLKRLPRLKKVVVLPNPVFCRPRHELQHSPSREPVVLFVGRLIPSKNVDRLIRIFQQVAEPGWTLRIVGDDAQGFSLRDDLEKLAERLGITDRVLFSGFQADMASVYRNSSVFAFPSSSEGFPNALAEALSFGLPAVAYDCSAGPSDLIDEGVNGFLVPNFDDALFAEKLALLMRESALRERMASDALRASKALAVEKIVPKLLQLAPVD